MFLGATGVDRVALGADIVWESITWTYLKPLLYNTPTTATGYDEAIAMGTETGTDIVALTSNTDVFQSKFEFANIALAVPGLPGPDTTVEHTANVSSSGTISASEDGFPDSEFFHLMDKMGGSSAWGPTTDFDNVQINYEYVVPTRCQGYGIIGYMYDDYYMESWKFEASDTGLFAGEEIVLDSQSDMVFLGGEEKQFTFTNDSTYLFYRLNVTAGKDNWSMSEWYLYGDSIAVVDLLLTESPIADGDNLVIVKDDDSINELVAAGVTSDTEPEIPGSMCGIALAGPEEEEVQLDSGTSDLGTSISDDGLYLFKNNGDTIERIRLLAPFILEGFDYAGDGDFIDLPANDYAIVCNHGTRLLASDSGTLSIYNLATPYLLASTDIVATSSLDIEPFPGALNISDDGLHIHYLNDRQDIYGLVLTTPFDLSTALDDGVVPIVAHSFCLNSDGTLLFANENATIDEYSFGVPYSISTLVLTGCQFDTASDSNMEASTIVDPSGKHMYISGYDSGPGNTLISHFSCDVNTKPSSTTYQMDTSVVTAGEVPSRTYTVDAKTSFNGQDAVNSGDTYVASPTVLASTRTHDDLVFDPVVASIDTEVTLKSIGDTVTEVSASIMVEG